MADKEENLLTDKLIYPTDDYIFSIIGDKKVLWQSIMNHMDVNYKDSSGEWNFYNDGKRWLYISCVTCNCGSFGTHRRNYGSKKSLNKRYLA